MPTFCFQVSMASKESLSTVENASTHAWAPVNNGQLTQSSAAQLVCFVCQQAWVSVCVRERGRGGVERERK